MTLKELTAEKHREAETQPFIKSIFSGKVDTLKYANYLYQLIFVYGAIEGAANGAKLLKGIENIQRAKFVEEDWLELIGENASRLLPSTKRYIEYLQMGTFWGDEKKIMAHLYVRHMGDLFGGQMLAKLLPGSCTMYKFENRENLILEMRKRIDVSLADEANLAFQYNIDIIKEFND
jgi:heme oxygenase